MTISKKVIIIAGVIGVGIIVALQKWDLLLYGILFLCPLMHIFMHSGHGGHDHNNGHSDDKNQSELSGRTDHSDHVKDKNSKSPHRGCH